MEFYKSFMLSKPGKKLSSLTLDLEDLLFSNEDKLLENLRSKIENTIFKPQNITLNDVIGLDEAKLALEDAVILPNELPEFVVSKKNKWKSILFHGPNGTGKFYLASALASESKNTKTFNFSIQEFLHELKNYPNKTFKCLFEIAQINKPSIILIKDIDQLLELRKNHGKCLIKYFSSQLKRLHEFDGILILCTTSESWRFSDKIKGLFERRIETSLPNENERFDIIKNKIRTKLNNLTDVQIKKLANETFSFSGGDLDFLIKNALRYPLRRARSATHFKRAERPSSEKPELIVNDFLIPCFHPDPDAVQMNWQQIGSNRLLLPTVTMDDFETSLKYCKQNLELADSDCNKVPDFDLHTKNIKKLKEPNRTYRELNEI